MVPWERAGPSASTAGESSPPYPWGQSDSSVARTRRHPQALRVSVVTGLVTNTVMHPCGNLGVGGVTPIEFMDTCMDTSLARTRGMFPEQAASRARVLFRELGVPSIVAFFLRFRHAAPARCGSQSPASSPTASRQGGVCRCGRSWRPQFAQHIAAVTRHKGHATSAADALKE